MLIGHGAVTMCRSTTFLAPLPDMENRQSTYEAFYDLYEVSVSVVEPRAALN